MTSNLAAVTARHQHALVVGASGGIGAALAAELRVQHPGIHITGWSRRPPEAATGPLDAWQPFDLRDEASIAAATAALPPTVDLVLVATGMLASADPLVQPEKTWRSIDPAALAELFAVNAIGPALVAKHVLPRLPRDRRAVFAALSARVGSIGDNHLGGWYGYRASKAALNQLLRTVSVELKLKWPLALCVGLHPGTVDTGLSRPFRPSVAGSKRVLPPGEAASHLIRVLDGLEPTESGYVFDWQGERVPD
jgi:NAD(P)-dependent dehydrogenase (short-subunit alcohol dehydrogenase family)